MTLQIIPKRTLFLTIALSMAVAGIIALFLWQLRLGIDFTGGSFLEIVYTASRPTTESLKQKIESVGIKEYEVKLAGDHGVMFRFGTMDEETHQKVLVELKKDDENLIQKSFESIGPVIGEELKSKSLWALVVALLAIMAYITYAFRKVSYPVASWKYGVSAIFALLHDLIFVLGIFAILGHFAGIEVTSSFIPAFLTVLGFSVHDTIVIFDRIRENLLKYRGNFEEVVNKSLNETIVRSINTSFTVLLVLLALYFLGGDTLRTFALALIFGIGVGTYSSIFVASPLLVAWHLMALKKKA
ncbi:protein translocase subunit SecF [Candidatus Uhrbacteria bacterium]|nr:protein translocase subunit SecF [Candidatus Uhrbacteria bacterium]